MALDKENIAAIYPLSDTQQALLFSSRSAASDPGFIQVQVELEGVLDGPVFEAAWDEMLHQHEALRMTLQTAKNNRSMLVVCKKVSMAWQWEDVRGEGGAERMAERLKADRERGLDLAEAPVMRMWMFQLDEQRHLMVWGCHHLFLDGWSVSSAIREALRRYHARREGKPLELSAQSTLADYQQWRKTYPGGEAKAYWREVLGGFSEPLSLAGLRATRRAPGFQRGELPVDPRLNDRLAATSLALKVTPAAILYAAFGLLMAAISGRDEAVFGSATAGRSFDLPGGASLLGYFASVNPQRLRFEAGRAVHELVTQVHRELIVSVQYEHVSLLEIQSCSDVPAHQPLFESLLVYQNFPVRDAEVEELVIRRLEGGVTSTFPLTFTIAQEQPLRMGFVVDERFDLALCTQVLSLFLPLLDRLCADPDEALSSLRTWLDSQLPDQVRSFLPTAEPPVVAEFNEFEPVEIQVPRNETELEIAKIWELLLGISPLDIHTEFIQYGGRSFVAVHMLSLVEERMGQRLSFAEFVADPTIAGMAKSLQQETPRGAWRSVVPIQPKGDRIPLFLIHGAGTHILFARALGLHLGAEQPLFGLQPVGLEGECPPIGSYEALAKLYVDEMIALHPSGPFYLTGQCLGAAVCFEVAQQLIKRGRAVPLLVIIDTYAPHASAQDAKERQARRGIKQQLKNLLTGKVIRAVRSLLRNVSRVVRRRRTLAQGSSLEKRKLYMRDVDEAGWRAHARYVAGHFPGTITLLRCPDKMDIAMDWDAIADRMEVIPIPIEHDRVFLEPEVQVLATEINRLLDEADQLNRASSRNSLLDESNSA